MPADIGRAGSSVRLDDAMFAASEKKSVCGPVRAKLRACYSAGRPESAGEVDSSKMAIAMISDGVTKRDHVHKSISPVFALPPQTRRARLTCRRPTAPRKLPAGSGRVFRDAVEASRRGARSGVMATSSCRVLASLMATRALSFIYITRLPTRARNSLLRPSRLRIVVNENSMTSDVFLT